MMGLGHEKSGYKSQRLLDSISKNKFTIMPIRH